MASDKPVASAGGADEADLAKAFQELARGERTATALEAQLTSMEAKIEALLAQAQKDQEEMEKKKGSSGKENAAESMDQQSNS